MIENANRNRTNFTQTTLSIPAFASMIGKKNFQPVIPVQAGIHLSALSIPASAVMTGVNVNSPVTYC